MSRYYRMKLTVSGFDTQLEAAIRNAATDIMPFGDWWEEPNVMSAEAESSLCGGESEREFANRLTMAIWKANGTPCKVEVNATCLDDIPSENFTLDKDSPLAKDFKPTQVEEE